MFDILASADAWVALLTLTFLEIVLGIDNIVFISLAANKLPKKDQRKATNIGLALARSEEHHPAARRILSDWPERTLLFCGYFVDVCRHQRTGPYFVLRRAIPAL